MKYRSAALTLLAIQLVLVLSVAGKYWCERRNCPRVWVKTAQYDPNTPLRGRYLGLQLIVDACNLPRDAAHFTPGYQYGSGRHKLGYWTWDVSLRAQNGRLAPQLRGHRKAPGEIQWLALVENQPCNFVPLASEAEYFIPDTAKVPFPLKHGQELWVEVTVPPSGPPRPIQLALSSEAGFQPIKFN
jgi:hypothetical protein